MTISAAAAPKPTPSSRSPFSAGADRLSESPFLLSLAGLEWLFAAGLVIPQPGSPLEPFSGPIRVTSLTQRRRAALELSSRLDQQLSSLARQPSFQPSWLGRALAVLERPEARVRVAIATPDRPAVVQTFFLREGVAVLGQADQEGFSIDRPLPVPELCELLARSASSQALPAEMVQLSVLPEIYELARVLWQGRGKGLGEPITKPELEGLLEDAPSRTDAAGELLGVLVEVGLLEPSGGRFFLSDGYRSWLEQVWSGNVLEIERTPLSSPLLEARSAERLLFAGPTDHRVLCEDILASADGPLVQLSRLAPGETRERLARLLASRPEGSLPTPATFGSARRQELEALLRGGGVH